MRTVASARHPRWYRTWTWLERHSGRLLVVMLVLFVLVFSIAAVRKYRLFRVGFDVALIHQAVWNTTQGRFLETHAYDFTDSLLGTDSFFMAAWLAPFYALAPSVHTLFVLEVVIVALGAIPLYLLARERLSPTLGLLTAGFYLVYLPVQYGTLYEIRFRMMAMAWLCFVFYYVEKQRYGAMLPFLFLALSCRLDTTIAVAMVGVYALLRKKRWYYGLTLLAAAVAWYLVMNQVILPHYSTRAGYMFGEHYLPLGRTPGEILRTIVTDPGLFVDVIFQPPKLLYLFQMSVPLLFLPVLAPEAFLSVLPLFLLNLLSNRKIQWDIYHHYQGLLVPFLLVGLVQAWSRLGDWDGPAWWPSWRRLSREGRLRTVGMLLLSAALFANIAFYNPLPPLLFGRAPERAAAAMALIERIPPKAPVGASNLLAPHIPVRRDIFLLPGGDFYYAFFPEGRADFLLLDLQSERGEEEAALMERVLQQGDWRVDAEQDGYVLLARQR